jgi:hypothetical protein
LLLLLLSCIVSFLSRFQRILFYHIVLCCLLACCRCLKIQRFIALKI